MDTKSKNKNSNSELNIAPFAYRVTVNDRLDFAVKALKLFNMKIKLLNDTNDGKNVPAIEERHIYLLAYYMIYGISKKTREDYAYVKNIGVQTVDVMSSRLSVAGFISRDKYNRNKLVLHPRIEELARFILKDTEKQKCFIFIIGEK
jgi:hypothetical protein